MKVVRRGVFETNSSSIHSITICSKEEFNAWRNDDLYLRDGKFYTKDAAIELLKSKEWYKNEDFTNELVVEDLLSDNFMTSKQFDRRCKQYEYFEKNCKTLSGDEIIAFGYYGRLD